MDFPRNFAISMYFEPTDVGHFEAQNLQKIVFQQFLNFIEFFNGASEMHMVIQKVMQFNALQVL